MHMCSLNIHVMQHQKILYFLRHFQTKHTRNAARNFEFNIVIIIVKAIWNKIILVYNIEEFILISLLYTTIVGITSHLTFSDSSTHQDTI